MPKGIRIETVTVRLKVQVKTYSPISTAERVQDLLAGGPFSDPIREQFDRMGLEIMDAKTTSNRG